MIEMIVCAVVIMVGFVLCVPIALVMNCIYDGVMAIPEPFNWWIAPAYIIALLWYFFYVAMFLRNVSISFRGSDDEPYVFKTRHKVFSIIMSVLSIIFLYLGLKIVGAQ